MYMKKFIKTMLKNTPIAYAIHKAIYNSKGNIKAYKTIDYNPSFLSIIEASINEPKGNQIDNFIYIIEEEIPEIKQGILKTIEENQSSLVTGYTSSYDKWLKFHLFPKGKNDFISLITDISKEKELENKLRKRSQELELILNSINDIVLVVNFDHIIVNINNAGKKLLGYEPKEVIGRPIYEFISNDTYEKILEKFREGFLTRANYVLRTHISKKNGSSLCIEWKTSIYENYIYSVGRDITDLVKKQEEILYLSYHDKLTGLYNRAFFEEELKRLDTSRHLPLSIIMGDVNGLKIINDVFGHLAGDRLLKNISNILSSSIREEDVLSRWGGDEFIILLPNTSEEVTRKIIQRIRDKCKNNTADLSYGDISLGYSVKESCDVDIMSIVLEAERSMYNNKVLEGKKTRNNILRHMMKYLYMEKYESKSHINQMKQLLEKMAIKLNLSKECLKKLLILAEYHDIGLISVSDRVLNKKENLTEVDWKEIKNHSEAGYRIAKAIPELSHVADHILHHHELWNGSGYPKALKGEEIPYINRIFSIVDAYNALIQDKPYRPSLSQEEAVDFLNKNKGFFFDPRLVKVFLEILKDQESSIPM